MGEPDSSSQAEPAPLGPGDLEQPQPAASRRDNAVRWALEVVVIVAAAFLLAILIQQFVLKPYVIPSPSMEPTLVQGDRVLVNRIVYHFRSPRVGDIVVFDPPGHVDGEPPLIKRVVGLGGDTVSVRDGVLWVNGVAQDEPFIKEHPIVEDFAEVKIDPGFVWAMGDNRNNSGDSRVFGAVSEDRIIGEAFAIYWPLRHIHGL